MQQRGSPARHAMDLALGNSIRLQYPAFWLNIKRFVVENLLFYSCPDELRIGGK
jgi:hypothetical protein